MLLLQCSCCSLYMLTCLWAVCGTSLWGVCLCDISLSFLVFQVANFMVLWKRTKEGLRRFPSAPTSRPALSFSLFLYFNEYIYFFFLSLYTYTLSMTNEVPNVNKQTKNNTRISDTPRGTPNNRHLTQFSDRVSTDSLNLSQEPRYLWGREWRMGWGEFAITTTPSCVSCCCSPCIKGPVKPLFRTNHSGFHQVAV